MRLLKVVLVGDTNVGKSCVLSRFVQETFDWNVPPTIGAAFLTKVITTANGSVRLQLWDTAGQEKFRSSATAVLVFDMTHKGSLDALEDWQAEIGYKALHHIKLVVIRNKTDVADERVVPRAPASTSRRNSVRSTTPKRPR
jgi:small GTP-binding protein